MYLDPTKSKAELMAEILEINPGISPSKAGRLAAKVIRGDLETGRPGHQDPTARDAVRNVTRQGR